MYHGISSELVFLPLTPCKGWQPSTFVSSRSTRHEQRGARPEDFMDEEDLEVCFLSLGILHCYGC